MEENEMLNSEVLRKRRKSNKLPVIILSMVLIIVIVLLIFASGMFKSNSQKFIELLTEDQYIVEMFKNRQDDFSTDGEKGYNVTVTKDVLSLAGIPSILIADDIELKGNIIKEGENVDSKITLSLGDTEIQKVEIIKEEEFTALNIPSLFENYVAVRNDNLDEVAMKLGYISGDDAENPEVIEGAKKIAKKYIKLISESISEYLEVEKNVEISVNANKFKTKQFKLKLGTVELNNIYLELLKELKDDEDTLKFIVINYIENDYNSDSTVEDLSTEELVAELKTEINNLYNEKLGVQFEEDEIESEIITIYAYSYKGKNIKTILDLNMEDAVYEVILETMDDDVNDFILLSITDSLGTQIDLKYAGAISKNEYNGKITIGANSAVITLADININEIENSEAKPRTVAELNALVLNDATDEEIANIKKKLDEEAENTNTNVNQGTSNEEEIKIYEEGDFKLDDPESKKLVLQNSIEAYNKLSPGMTKAEAIAIMGEPDDVEVTNAAEYIYWYQYDDIYLISAGIRNDMISEVYNDIVSSMEDNVQVSTEIGTEIQDLNEGVSKLDYGMTLQEVENILGNKYIAVKKDSLGYSKVKWYDKKENSVEINFDNKNTVWKIGKVSADK